MKKILSYLIAVALMFFVGLVFLVFEIWPFNVGGPIIGEDIRIESDSESSLQGSSIEIPEFLEGDKVERAKSYTEHMKRGKVLHEQGYHSLAIAEYEAALKISGPNPSPIIQIGIIHFETDDLLKAKLSFEEALKVDTDNLNANIYLGRTLIADRDLSEAQRIFNSIEIHNQTSKYYQALVSAYANDHEKAKTLFHEVINIGGNTNLSSFAQNFLKAYEEFDSNQGGMELHLKTLLARSYIKADEFDIAIPLLFDVIKNKKDYRDAWTLLGYAYLQTEKYQDAVEALTEARILDPSKSEITFFLGIGYYGLEDFDKAIQYLELAKTNGFEPVIQVNQKLAEIYLQLKEYDKSAENYEDALTLNDEDVYYYIKPIWIYIDRLNKPEKAFALANKAIASHPTNAMSYNLLGWASVATNNLPEAKTLLDKANALDPNMDAVYLNYGLLYEKSGDNNTAIENYIQAYEMGNGNSISDAAADKYNKLIGKSENFDYSILKADVLNQ